MWMLTLVTILFLLRDSNIHLVTEKIVFMYWNFVIHISQKLTTITKDAVETGMYNCTVYYTNGNSTTTEEDFEYLKLEENTDGFVLSPVPDIEEVVDEWPSGAYTLFMSKFGCPRGRWNRGYLSFTWQTPHVMVSHTHTGQCSNHPAESDTETQCHWLLSKKTWPTSHSNMLGPFSEYKMTLNFCQRMNTTESDDRVSNSTWPQAYFQMFGTDAGCPQGFHEEGTTLTLPPVVTWSENGYLPQFNVKTEYNSTVLTLGECVRDEPIEMNATHHLNTNKSSYILLKHKDYPCPEIESYDVRPEMISLVSGRDAATSMSRDTSSSLFQFCYYQPVEWNVHGTEKSTIKGYYLEKISLIYGGTEELQENLGTATSDFHTHTIFCSKHTTCWLLIDMGRSYLIKAVTFPFPERVSYYKTVQAGNDKWELLKYGGVEIRSDRDSRQFVGRYITVTMQNSSVFPASSILIRIYVERTDQMCMFDLGMADGRISTDQISTSDKTSDMLDYVRAFNSGWCANSEDPDPFIQVDLLEETVLDGITIHNWYKTEINVTQGAYTKYFTPMGTRSFILMYSSNGYSFSNNVSFYLDLFRPTDESQTFIFYKQIQARHVRIMLLVPMTPGQFCIRFELQGCLTNAPVNRPYLSKHIIDIGDTIIGAFQTMTSPSQFNSIGYPSPGRDGTQYFVIIDFRNIGFIKVIFKEITLQNYEDRSLLKSWYHCKDELILSGMNRSYWSIPTVTEHKNIMIESEERYLFMIFKSCRPYTPRNTEGTLFKGYVIKNDMASCGHRQPITDELDHDKSISNPCGFSTMMLSTFSLKNPKFENYENTWHLRIPKFSVRLVITYFYTTCSSGTMLEVADPFSGTISYTNCYRPRKILLSESENMTIAYKVGQTSSNSYGSLMEEGFRAIYTAVETDHSQMLDTIGHNFLGLQSMEYVDTPTSGEANNGTSVLIYKACSLGFMKCYSIFTGKPMTWQIAGDECWARGQKMVSIRTKEELKTVKYMLRSYKNVKVDDGTIGSVFSTKVVDPNYYSHLGLSRTVRDDGNWQFVWQDGSPVLFTAWNEQQPKSDGDCVRMSFHLANQNNTWEVEDCYTQLALFFICESPVDSLPLPDLVSVVPKRYTGKMNMTDGGRLCKRWDFNFPDLHSYNASDFPDVDLSSAENYCRDPSDSGYLWCYTVDPNIRWKRCPNVKLDEWSSGAYNGRLSKTGSGRTCQRWDSQRPHEHSRSNPDYFPDETLFDAANYCRDPMRDTGALWCYTTDYKKRWDYCKLKDTVSDRCYQTHYPYTGTMNVTYSGLQCQRWDASSPHVPTAYGDNDFPEGKKSDAENYCRDPQDDGFVWCYTMDPEVRWEVCLVQDNKSYRPEVPSYAMYTCNDRKKISTKKLCNGLVDCPDAEDEQDCHVQVHQLLETPTSSFGDGMRNGTQFVCGSSEIMSFLAECDGIVDCIDGTDERNCTKYKTECTKDEYQCGDGRCIHASLVCDFIPHCTDHSDEDCDFPKCNYGEHRCDNGQCIPIEKRCNAFKDCLDGTDEISCDTCSTEAFHCDLTKCIPKRLECDGVADCRDRNDEKLCTVKSYPTCEDRWLNGHTESGIYSLNENTVVTCNFDNARIDGSVMTIFQTYADPDRARNWYPVKLLNAVDDDFTKFLFDEDYLCYIQFFQRCTLAVRTIAEIEDPNYEHEYRHCRCVAMTVVRVFYEYVHDCENETLVLNESLLYFNFYEGFYGTEHFLKKDIPFNDDIEIEVGPITCINDVALKTFKKATDYDGKHNLTEAGIPCQRWDEQSPHEHVYTNPEWFSDTSLEDAGNFCRDPSWLGYLWCYTTDPAIRFQNCSQNGLEFIDVTTILTCGDDDITYSASDRCVYNTDRAGNIFGCRSGSHLQDCSEFVCPNGTVKCPGSYCIPLHYVCDGISQCPDSSDELGCGCGNDDLEVILLISRDEFFDFDSTLRQMAGHFNSRGSIVRMLYYDTNSNVPSIPYGHLLMKITDTAVDQRDVISREHACSYKIPASSFMDYIQFTNATSRALIILKNGTESETVAQTIFRNMSKPDFDVYKVVIGSSSNLEQEYRYVTDIAVKSLDIAASIGSRLFPSLCQESSSTYCQDNYKCSSSKLCIALDKVCDGHAHCPFHDDEMFCDFVCPALCLCSGYSADCSAAAFDNSTDVNRDMDRRLRNLDLSTNTQVGEFGSSNVDFVLDFPYLIKLNLSFCSIKQLSTNYFENLPNLRSLDLSGNKISRIPRRTFYGLSKLQYLNLYGNEGFMTYESYAFIGLTSLRNLDILDSNIDVISMKTFSGLRLDTLRINNNKILEISNDAFGGLTVNKINIESNSVKTFDRGLFNGIFEIKSLKSSAYKYCCIRPDYLPESACFPERDEFSSCDDLMRNSALQTMLWLMGICALLGNILAIVYRIVYDRQRLKLGYGIFVTNLAVADLFMGVYLLIIASADASFRQIYIFMDEYWRNSVWCTLAGVLSTVSSEASVLFLCLITLDRFIVIKYPFSRLRFTPGNAGIAASVAWLISISISVIPLVATEHFQNKFYTKSGVCVALPLTRDRPPGWLYSVIVFIGVNFVTFIVIALGQLSIYREINNVSSKIKQRRGGKSKASRRKELTIARNLLLVVATDFLCWFPIGCMGMMAMSGYVIPGEVYAWVAVFILPVNSALNPVLYTLTAILGKRKQKATVDQSLSTRVKKSTIRRKRGMEKMFAYFLPRKEKPGLSMLSLEHVIQQKMEIGLDVLLKLTIQLTDCLRLLHKNSLILENLDANNVFITMEFGKISGNIQVREHPKNGASLENKKENLYKLGVLVRRLTKLNQE